MKVAFGKVSTDLSGSDAMADVVSPAAGDAAAGPGSPGLLAARLLRLRLRPDAPFIPVSE